jgi:5-methylthioribose kinase
MEMAERQQGDRDDSLGDDVRGVLTKMGLVDSSADYHFTPLSGGVSSDIWLIKGGEQSFVLKRPKHRLNVLSEWVVPVRRGQAEVDWLKCVGEHFPHSVPEVLGYDPDTFAIALNYFEPDSYTNWRMELMDGHVDSDFAFQLGELLAHIHTMTYERQELADTFANDDLFESLRIEPFLQRSAVAVPALSEPINRVIFSLRMNRLALVHGDFSPKNILVSHTGDLPRPIVLDAECAVWGDPAFDVAFCLAHLALKSVHVDNSSAQLIDAATAFRTRYLECCPSQLGEQLDQRLRALVPALLLARVVGQSPVDYLSVEEKALVSSAAQASLLSGEPCGFSLHPEKGLSQSPW